MLDFRFNSSGTVRTCHWAVILSFGTLFFLSVWANFAPFVNLKQAKTPISLPRNYCLANVALLGTGLMRAPILSGTKTKYRTQKGTLWAGWVRASASGRYEFRIPDRRGYISVNKQQIFSRSAMSSKPNVIEIELFTNRFYAIAVETPSSGRSPLQLQWRRPDGRREAVPKAYLYAPIATADGSETNPTVAIQ